MKVEIPDGWQQGRGAFGGLVIAQLLRAMAQSDRALRTVNATLCGPVEVGEADVEVETLRTGNAVSTLAARIVQRGEVQAHAVAVYGKARVSDGTWQERHKPTFAEAEALEIGPPLAPVFTQHFEFRPTGALPFSGEGNSVTGWVRPKVMPATRDAIYLAQCADAYWPAAWIRFKEPRPIATLTYMLQIMSNDIPETPLYHVGTAESSLDGYSAEHRELWSADGRLLAVNDQTIAIIK